MPAEWISLPVFKQEDLLESCMEDMDLVKDIVKTVLDDVPKNFNLLDTALAAGDLETARRAAHSIKSVARQLGGVRLAAIMLEQEMSLKDGLPPSAPAATAAKPAWDEFRAALIGISGITE